MKVYTIVPVAKVAVRQACFVFKTGLKGGHNIDTKALWRFTHSITVLQGLNFIL